MDIARIDKTVASTDGEHTLHGVVFVPNGEIKGIFQVVHGMQEYIGRYESFMRDIASDGYVVFGHDHLGHGLTAEDGGEFGFIAHKGGWERLIDDVGMFAGVVRKEYGEKLPYILMGHSMGSFVVRHAAVRFNAYDKLIIMGTGGPNPASGAGIVMTKLIKAVKGERHCSDLLEKLAFGSYNDKFSEGSAHDWLSVNRENIAKYEKDKYCTFRFTASAMEDLMHLTHECNRAKWFSAVDKQKPVLLVSGRDDPVGGHGKGVETVYGRLRGSSVNVELKLYDGYRHEILNDECRDEVVRDIKKFIEK